MEHWDIKPPKDDDEYFERMSHAIFQSGLNWQVIENKWPEFNKAFADWSIDKVAGFDEGKVQKLMSDAEIVRNESKIRATIHNAQEFQKIRKVSGSFKKYMDSFRNDHESLLEDLQLRFRHVGASTSRTFLWMAGVKLAPNAEEKAWMAKQEGRERSTD